MQYIFHLTEGDIEKFAVGLLEGPFRVGVPFNIPLDMKDMHGNPAKATGLNLKPVLESRYGTRC